MKYLKTITYLLSLFFVSNSVVFAQNTTWLDSIANGLVDVTGTLVLFLGSLALVYFIWGLVVFIAQSGNEQAVAEGKQKMIWGIIFLFVLVSVWGLVALLRTVSGVGSGTAPTAPQTTY